MIPPRNARDPSPGPLRLMKAPAAGHPLPKGEGCAIAGDVHPISRSSDHPITRSPDSSSFQPEPVGGVVKLTYPDQSLRLLNLLSLYGRLNPLERFGKAGDHPARPFAHSED